MLIEITHMLQLQEGMKISDVITTYCSDPLINCKSCGKAHKFIFFLPDAVIIIATFHNKLIDKLVITVNAKPIIIKG